MRARLNRVFLDGNTGFVDLVNPVENISYIPKDEGVIADEPGAIYASWPKMTGKEPVDEPYRVQGRFCPESVTPVSLYGAKIRDLETGRERGDVTQVGKVFVDQVKSALSVFDESPEMKESAKIFLESFLDNIGAGYSPRWAIKFAYNGEWGGGPMLQLSAIRHALGIKEPHTDR